MANIAIIIWSSSYSGELKPLPACARDGEAISKVISQEPRFDDVLLIEDEKSSVVAMGKLSEFVGKYKGADIEEVFFYFSGHGESREDDFLYLLPGYKSSAKMSTSIVNSQLDDLVRTLNPRLFVKIVDACESGTQYIKDAGHIDSIEKGKRGFRDVFFFSSSQSDDKSYLDSHLSYFTESIISAIQNHPIEPLRYVNLLNAVADFFALLDFQRPYVVQQGALDNVFCNASADLKASLQPFIRVLAGPASDEAAKSDLPSMIDLIKADADTYCTKAEVMDAVRRIPSHFAGMSLSEGLEGIYTFSTEVLPLDHISNLKPVGEHIRSSRNSVNWFASPTYTMEEYQKRVRKERGGNIFAASATWRRLTEMSDNPDDYTTITAKRPVVTGVRHTTQTEVPAVVVYALSQWPNVPQVRCYVIPIVSETMILLSYCIIHYEKSDWDEVRETGLVEWVFDEAKLKDDSSFEGLLNRASDRFRSLLESPIKARFSNHSPESVERPSKAAIFIEGVPLSG